MPDRPAPSPPPTPLLESVRAEAADHRRGAECLAAEGLEAEAARARAEMSMAQGRLAVLRKRSRSAEW